MIIGMRAGLKGALRRATGFKMDRDEGENESVEMG